MRIIYMHHAQRDIGPNREDKELAQLEDITQLGIEEAKLSAEMLKDKKIKAIVTSPYIRCKHTARIINEYHNVPIIEDERFNEMDYYNNEEYETFLKRNMNAIDDIVKKYNDDDIIVCVTSGINLGAFICYFYNIKPTNNTKWCQALQISPISFSIGRWDL